MPDDELSAHLRKALPEYMVPAAFVSLASIPLSSNGKADRGALARLQVTITSAQEYMAPRTESERQLVEIWAQVLNRDPETIGVNDNFFESGGHSLLAVRLIERMRKQGMQVDLQALFTAPTLAKLAAAVEEEQTSAIVVSEELPDLEREATLDPGIVLRTEGNPGELRNAFLTGATGFLGAFLLSDLLTETQATVHCLVRAADAEGGYRKIAGRLKAFGLWNPAVAGRIVPIPGDLASPLLGMTRAKFDELADTVDAIYHNGASVNFYYPYSVLKAANVLSTEQLLRMASYGRSKSFHFVSTLHVLTGRERNGSGQIIRDSDPLPGAHTLPDGYAQTKWVAEKIVAIAASRGIPVVTYRPAQIIGHSATGVAGLDDFVPAFIRGCMETGGVPELEIHDNRHHLVPVDYVSRAIVAMSQKPALFGSVFNLTNPVPTYRRDLLDHLLKFDPSLTKVAYEEWRSRVADDPSNALTKYIAAFPERLSKDDTSKRVNHRLNRGRFGAAM